MGGLSSRPLCVLLHSGRFLRWSTQSRLRHMLPLQAQVPSYCHVLSWTVYCCLFISASFSRDFSHHRNAFFLCPFEQAKYFLRFYRIDPFQKSACIPQNILVSGSVGFVLLYFIFSCVHPGMRETWPNCPALGPVHGLSACWEIPLGRSAREHVRVHSSELSNPQMGAAGSPIYSWLARRQVTTWDL